jgi:hypothetical protein
MISTSILPALLATLSFAAAQSTTDPVTGILGNASVVENNPPGVVYTATLPEKQFFNPNDPRGNIKGSVVAVANPNGIGVSFQINVSNLPTSGGPFRKAFTTFGAHHILTLHSIPSTRVPSSSGWQL